MEGHIYMNQDQATELERLFRSVKNKFNLRMIRTSNKKNLQKFYRDISFPKKDVKLKHSEVEELVDKRLLRFMSRKDGTLTLTLKAILMLGFGIMNPSNRVDELLNSFNAEFFEKIIGSVEQLDSDEKAVIIALMGLGALSDEYSLKVDETNEDFFRDAVDRAVEFLKSLGSEFDDKKLDKIWTRNVVGEGRVLGLMRRTNKIPIRTENIYKKQRQGHYLDILANNDVDETKFTFLLTRLFDKRPLTYQEKGSLVTTLDEIQQCEFRIFKNAPPFDSFEVRRQIKRLIESEA